MADTREGATAVEDARLSYEAHMGQMVESYPQLVVVPWDEQDGCFVGIGGAIQHRLWWAIPLLALGGVFFFIATPGDGDD